MGDISIPSLLSQNDNDWAKQIENALKKERIPVQRLEKKLETYQTQKGTWDEVRQNVNKLSTAASDLYQFGNPFSARIVRSENEKVVSASAQAAASLGTHALFVHKLASADRIISTPLSSDFIVQDGTYRFQIGKQEVRFHFSNKKLNDFVSTLNTEGKNVLQAFLIQINEDDTVLAINSLLKGESNRLHLHDAAEILAKESGMLNEGSVNFLETASNAQLVIDGIAVEREDNIIDNILPAVTFELHEASKEEVYITIEPDIEAAKSSIIHFIGLYNQTMQNINILTRTQPEIIEEITYFTQEEREAAKRKLGSMSGDSALTRLAASLQSATRGKSSGNRVMPVLESIGIRSKAFSRNSSGESVRLLGYLEINESELDDALKNHFSDVAALFGNDSNGDLIIDSGIAYDVSGAIRQYTQSGGVIGSRVARIDTIVEDTQKQIERYNIKIEKLESELVQQFSRLEQQIQLMEKNSTTLQNLSSNTRR